MGSYVYIVTWYPTAYNQEEQQLARSSENDFRLRPKSFSSPEEAANYAIDHAIYPFVVERVENNG